MSRSNKRGVATGAGVDPRTGKSAGANGEDAIEAEARRQQRSLNASSTTESASGEDETKGNGPSKASQQPQSLTVRNTSKSTRIVVSTTAVGQVGLFLSAKQRTELIKAHPRIRAMRSSNAMRVLASLFPEQYARLNANQKPSAATAEAVVKLWGQFLNLDRALLFTAKKGYAEVVRVLIELGADISARDRLKKTALHEAAWCGYADVVRVLVELGADISVRDCLNKTALHDAASGGEHVGVVRVLVKAGANVSEKDVSGRTALHCAAKSGHADVVRVLVELGADVNVQDGDGRTALRKAVMAGDVKMVRVLGELGANVTKRDSCDRGVLEPSLKVLALFFPEQWARLNDNQKPSAATAEAVVKLWGQFLNLDRALLFTAKKGYAEVVRALVELGADVSAHDAFKETALHYAAENGRAEVVCALIELGADVLARDAYGQTALEIAINQVTSDTAVYRGCAESMLALIKGGAQIDRLSSDKLKKVLFVAIKHRDRVMVAQMLNSGVSAGAINEFGHSALEAARKAGGKAILLQIQTALAVAESEQSPLGCRIM